DLALVIGANFAEGLGLFADFLDGILIEAALADLGQLVVDRLGLFLEFAVELGDRALLLRGQIQLFLKGVGNERPLCAAAKAAAESAGALAGSLLLLLLLLVLAKRGQRNCHARESDREGHQPTCANHDAASPKGTVIFGIL